MAVGRGLPRPTMTRVLIPLPDRDFDVTEVAVPWRLLTRRDIEVVFATPQGGIAAADPLLLTGVIFGQLGAEPEAKAFYEQMTRVKAFQSPLRYDAIEWESFDGLLLPGGHAKGMRPYLESTELRAGVREFWALRRPVAAICHGVLVLARTVVPETGRSVLFDRRTTCLPAYMEKAAHLATFWKLGDYYRTYPVTVEEEVVQALAHHEQFVRGPITLFSKGKEHDASAAFVVDDGHYLSARWPGDAYKLATLFADKLIARQGRASFRGLDRRPPGAL
jgi:putative intracellular protease/amidase